MAMQREDFHILIVDDDAHLGRAMGEALTREGYKTTHVMRPDEVINIVRIQQVHAAIIDCMLPKMSGVELAKKLREEVTNRLPIILISGIYKDKAFQRDALQSTGAVTFINKPFELSEFVTAVNDIVKPFVDAPLAMLHQFLAKHDISPKERIRAVDDAEMIHCFDLPWVFSLLMHEKVNGHLNIISAEGDVAGVGFLGGDIVQVYLDDTKSYFGVLMVEYGFISQAELDEVMRTSKSTKKLGEKLVAANVLSPHAIHIVMAEQQGLRLSKTIKNTSVKINFIETSDMRVNARTDRNAFTKLLNEWLVSKYSLDWLKSYYTPWMRYNLHKGPEWTADAEPRVFSIPVVKRVPDIAKILLLGPTLEEALTKFKEPEDHVFRALHALIVTRTLRFGEVVAKSDFQAQRERLRKLLKSLDSQNYFERLGVSQKAKESEIKRAYHDLAKVLHPDKLPQDAPDDVRTLAKETFERISTAYSVLSDPKAKEEYLLELEKGRSEAVMQAEALAGQARPLLSKGDFSQARELLEKAMSLASPTSEMRLLWIWSQIKGAGPERNPLLLSQLKDELAQIPPEDRHHSTYYFVKALVLKASGDLAGAKRNLQYVLSEAPDFIDARRELNIISQQEQAAKTTNIFNGDLRDVVGMLFKKRR